MLRHQEASSTRIIDCWAKLATSSPSWLYTWPATERRAAGRHRARLGDEQPLVDPERAVEEHVVADDRGPQCDVRVALAPLAVREQRRADERQLTAEREQRLVNRRVVVEPLADAPPQRQLVRLGPTIVEVGVADDAGLPREQPEVDRAGVVGLTRRFRHRLVVLHAGCGTVAHHGGPEPDGGDAVATWLRRIDPQRGVRRSGVQRGHVVVERAGVAGAAGEHDVDRLDRHVRECPRGDDRGLADHLAAEHVAAGQAERAGPPAGRVVGVASSTSVRQVSKLVERDHRVCGSPGVRRVTTSSWTVVWRYNSSNRGAPPRARSSVPISVGIELDEPSTVSTTSVRFSQRWNSWSVVKPMPASTCWALVAVVRAALPASDLATRGEQRVDVVGAGVRHRGRALRSPRATRRACAARLGTRPPTDRTARGRRRGSGPRRASSARPRSADGRAPPAPPRPPPPTRPFRPRRRASARPRTNRTRRRAGRSRVGGRGSRGRARRPGRSGTWSASTATSSTPAPSPAAIARTTVSAVSMRAETRPSMRMTSPSRVAGGVGTMGAGSTTHVVGATSSPSAWASTSSMMAADDPVAPSAVKAMAAPWLGRGGEQFAPAEVEQRGVGFARSRCGEHRRGETVGEHRQVVGVDPDGVVHARHDSAPRSSRRRATMLRWISDVPP